MSEVVLHPDATAFPPGTAVKVYPRQAPETPELKGQPAGTLVEEPTVASNGTLTVAGLTAGTPYIGWSQRSGVDYYLRFRVDVVSGGGGSPTGAASGALAGEYPGPEIATGAVTATQLAASAVTSAKLAAKAVEGSKIAEKTIEKANLTTKAIEELAGAGGTPTGAAGGDLAGEYPNPTIGATKVTAAKLGAEAVEASKIKAGAVEESKLSAGVIAKWATAQENAELASSPAIKVKATAVTAAQTAPLDELLRVDATAATLTITLPAPEASNKRHRVGVEKTDTSTHEVLLEGNIRGVAASTITLRLQNETAFLVSDGASWYPVEKYLRVATLDGRYILAETGAVTSSELGTAVVTAAKIASEAVEAAAIHSSAVTAAKIASEAVETAAIKAEAVTAAKLATNSVESAKIAAEAVGTAKLAATAVTEPKLGSEAVTAAKLAANAVETAKIAASAVTAAKIAAEAVTTEKLANEAVTSAKRTKIVLEQKMRFAIGSAVEAIKYPGGFEPAAGWSIIKAEYEILEGTSVEVEVLKNGAAITGLTGLKAEKAKGEKAQTQALTEGDKIDIKCSSPTGSPKGLALTLHLTKEV